jgi:hypothetical protein
MTNRIGFATPQSALLKERLPPACRLNQPATSKVAAKVQRARLPSRRITEPAVWKPPLLDIRFAALVLPITLSRRSVAKADQRSTLNFSS